MLDSIRSIARGWLGKVILAVITVPFMLFGIDAYLSNAGDGVAVAEVNGYKISVQAYANELQAVRNRLKTERTLSDAELDSLPFKLFVLDQLINRQLFSQEVRRAHFAISDENLSRHIINMSEFQKQGQFSQETYDQLLHSNGLTPEKFEQRLRADLLAGQVRDSIARLGFVTHREVEDWQKIQYQQRAVAVFDVQPDSFLANTAVTDSQVKSYYQAHADSFRLPEKVKIEFVVMSANHLIQSVKIDEMEFNKFYTENASKFQSDEKRRASHILISFGSATPTALQKQSAREKAESLLKQLHQTPARFAQLAKQHSQDPGSASQGGDLGSFGRGSMVKPFEDKVFGMRVGEISDIVESDFGYHIIRLDGIEGQENSAVTQAKAKGEFVFQKAQALFIEKAEKFSDDVYKNIGLQTTAKAFGLEVQTSDWLTREQGAKLFKSDKVMTAVFSPEVLKDGRNTEAIDVGNNTLISARVLGYQPSTLRALSEVQDSIKQSLRHAQALTLAQQMAKQWLADLQKGKIVSAVNWTAPLLISRQNTQGLKAEIVQQAFKVNTNSLPAYTGLNHTQGYSLIRVSQVVDGKPDAADTDGAKTESALRSALDQAYLNAYVRHLRGNDNVKIHPNALRDVTANNAQ